MKSKHWCLLESRPLSPILFLIYLLCFLAHKSEAICPTRFYAQAVTLQRASELDIYFSRAQVETAADCAIFCGKRQFCRSAVYNHDTKNCALSYDKVVECNTQKQRYNTFHLTTDGAESTSIITCVELCTRDKPKFQDTKPTTLFSRNDNVHEEDGMNSAARFLAGMTSDTKSDLKTPEHGSGHSGQFVAISKGRTHLKSDGTAELPPEIVVAETPSTQIIEALQRLMHGMNKTSNNSTLTAGKPAQSGQLIGKIETETQLSTNGGKELDTAKEDKNDVEAINSLGLKTHQKVIKKTQDEKNPPKKSTKGDKHELTSNDLIVGDSSKYKSKVRFRAHPLEIQEIFNGTSNSTSLGQGEVYHSGGTQDRNSGGFFKWLKPGERFTLPPEVHLPPEVARLVPELLSAVGKGQVNKLKGTGLSFEITEKDTQPQKTNSTLNNSTDTQPEPKRRTLTRFAKIKVEESESTEDAKEERKEKSEEEKVKEVFSSAASSLDQVVVNGRLLSIDEANKLRKQELSSSTSTTTPKPWKPASQLFGASEEDDEDETTTSTTAKTPAIDRPHRDSKPNGYLNTFLIQGISSMIHQNDAHHPPRSKIDNSEKRILFTTTSTTTQAPITTSSGPIVCYRQIPQQVLLYAAFETLHGISLNECRCRCAETWLNLTAENSNNGPPRCKSVLYNEITRECSLNQGDHNGKYDLIYDKFIDYHYVSCEIKYLLSAARRVCSKILPSIAQNLPSPLKIRRPNENDENTSEPLLRDQQQTQKHDVEKVMTGSKRLQVLSHPEDPTTTTQATPAATPINLDEPEATTQTHKLAASTKEIPKLQKIDEKTTKQSNQLSTQTQKIATVELTATPAPLTTTISKAETTTGEDSDLLIQEVDPAPKPRKVIRPKSGNIDTTTQHATTQKPITKFLDEFQTTSDPSEKRVTTQRKETPEIIVSTQSTTPVLPSTTTTSYDPLIISGYTDGCFEVIEGYSMQNTAGGLERDVESMSECQCYCANSLSSRRYAFQCISATYYHEEKLCALNLDNRQIRPESFERRSVDAGNVTYLGLVCPQQKAVELHTKRGQCKKELQSTSSTTTTTTAKPAAVNTDDCFLELPSYVLEGTALAVETNVSVDECKCYCVDSGRRYGDDCQSLEYYYDSQTCLLNKENRISDPDRFNYDAHGLQHSYFDYRCHAEKITLAVYVENVCSKVSNLKISDIQPTTDNSLDIDDDRRGHDNEVRLVTQTQSPIDSKSEVTQRVKILKFINENEDDGAGLDNAAEEKSEERKEQRKPRKHKSRTRQQLETTSTSTLPTTTTVSLVLERSSDRVTISEHQLEQRPSIGRLLPEVDELEGEEELKRFEATSTTPKPPTTKTTTVRPTTTTTRATTTTRPTTTTTVITTTEKSYLPVGQCRYSALYQTAFNGERLIRRFKVQNAAECFAGCHWERCRSANLIQSGGSIKHCELYRDSIVDFRRTDVLYFDRDTVHFDSISCDEKPN